MYLANSPSIADGELHVHVNPAIAGTAHEYREAPDAMGHCDECGLLGASAVHVPVFLPAAGTAS